MKYKELQKLDDKELIIKLDENKTEHIDKKHAILNNQLQDTSVLSKIKKKFQIFMTLEAILFATHLVVCLKQTTCLQHLHSQKKQ